MAPGHPSLLPPGYLFISPSSPPGPPVTSTSGLHSIACLHPSLVPVTSRHCLIKVCFFDRKRNFIYLCWLEMTFSSGVVSEKLHFLPCTSFYILPASVSNYLSRDSTDEMVTAHTGFQEPTEHTSSQLHVHGWHTGRLKGNIAGMFTVWKYLSTIKEGLYFWKASC